MQIVKRLSPLQADGIITPCNCIAKGDCKQVEAIEQAIVAFLKTVLHTIHWPGVVIIMALESANIPIPSEVTMPLAGWMLVQASGLSLWHAIGLGGLFGALGCTIGSLGSYALGFYGGRPLLKKYGRYILVSEHDLKQAEHWFARWGDWAAFISRLLPIVRTFISFPAGVVRVPLFRFAVLTFVGSFLWCGALAAAGYWFGSQWELIRTAMRPFDIPIAIVILGGFAYYVYRHVKRARSPTAAEPTSD
jgi:membrane protein DedA with SNARE-associated domain